MSLKSKKCHQFDKVVDILMYLMMCKKLDIALAMSKMNRYISNPRKSHCKSFGCNFKYLKSTKYLGIIFDDLLDNVKYSLDQVDFE